MFLETTITGWGDIATGVHTGGNVHHEKDYMYLINPRRVIISAWESFTVLPCRLNCWPVIHRLPIQYKYIHELSLSINFYETSLENVIKQASGELYYLSGTSFIKVFIKLTTSVRFSKSCDFYSAQGPATWHTVHSSCIEIEFSYVIKLNKSLLWQIKIYITLEKSLNKHSHYNCCLLQQFNASYSQFFLFS